MAKHTSGPWEVGIWERHIWVGGGPNNDDIAEFNFADEHTVKISREEAIANARLFQAAPALLAAAEAVCEVHLQQRALWPKVYAGDASDDDVNAVFAAGAETGEKIDILRDALAKAASEASRQEAGK